ncbi:lytic transglycosylase domain-containing protein [Burkholderia plantarii]|uniref:Putative lytic transglycosylase n=1 Tax=Burkholderia plantarii TaxID=41899 RepID=A0A0B6RYC5_BURPL|nr:lytic transglycosylase domain-containing protein [Burkholderia plantarii]AJK47179.1 putative lytic transglycosylase [Burkholderia plantarii]
MSLSVSSVGSSSFDPTQNSAVSQALQQLQQIEQLIRALIAALQMTASLNNNPSPSVGGVGGGGGGGGGMPSFGGGGLGGGGVGAPSTLAAAAPAATPATGAASGAIPGADAATSTTPTTDATTTPQPASASAVQSPPATSGGDMTPQQVASKYNSEIMSASQATGVPPGILAGQIWQESKGVADTPGGGLMQLGPDEFQKYGGGDISNPADNIRAGANYMKDLAAQFGGNMDAALRAYNSGPNGVDLGNLNSTPAGTGDPTYVQKVTQAAQESGLATT